MKKLISIAAVLALLLTGASCAKGENNEGMEQAGIKVESQSGKNISASMWYPDDAGLVFYEGEYDSMGFFTDEEDGYEMILELYADSDTDIDYFRNSDYYEKTKLGNHESFLIAEDGLYVYYVFLGTLGDETVYLELDVYTLHDDSGVDLDAVMASEEVLEIMESIEYKEVK